MEIIITEIAQRIRDLREIMGYSVEEMAQAVDCTPEEYIAAGICPAIPRRRV